MQPINSVFWILVASDSKVKCIIKILIEVFMRNLIFIIVVSLVFVACQQSQKKVAKEEIKLLEENMDVDEELVDEFNQAKQIFYALPSPVETAMLIKRAGTQYDGSLVNKTEYASNYNTSLLKSLNFGIYGTDLSYTSLFSQTQEAVSYMAVSKQLADEIGILEFMNSDIVERLENNINNRDSSMEIITESFMTSNEFLKESGRPEVAAIIIAGGWIEGLYIATSLAKNSPYNNELVDRIIDQKLSLITLKGLLENYTDSKDVIIVLGMVNDIYEVYNKVQIVSSKVEPLTDKESKITTLQAKTEIFISDEVFDELCHKVDSLRESIVNI